MTSQLDLVLGIIPTVFIIFIIFFLIICFPFSALAIAEPPRESYGDDDSDSLTGSMLSLNRPGNNYYF